MSTDNIVMWESLPIRSGPFQTSEFAGDLEDSKSISGGVLCIVGSHTFVLKLDVQETQLQFSHISTEAEIFSLETGLTHRRYFRSHSWGYGDTKYSFCTEQG